MGAYDILIFIFSENVVRIENRVKERLLKSKSSMLQWKRGYSSLAMINAI